MPNQIIKPSQLIIGVEDILAVANGMSLKELNARKQAVKDWESSLTLNRQVDAERALRRENRFSAKVAMTMSSLLCALTVIAAFLI